MLFQLTDHAHRGSSPVGRVVILGLGVHGNGRFGHCSLNVFVGAITVVGISGGLVGRTNDTPHFISLLGLTRKP